MRGFWRSSPGQTDQSAESKNNAMKLRPPQSVWAKLEQLPGKRLDETKRPYPLLATSVPPSFSGRKQFAHTRRLTPLRETIAAFWGMVHRPDLTACWEWLGGINPQGYGNFYLLGRSASAHRIAFALWHDKDPAGWVLHRCDNRKCCNPAHLFEGDALLNNRDCNTKGRRNMLRGEQHQDCVLSDSDILEISKMDLRKGMYGPLIQRFKVSYKTLWAISRGKYRRKPCTVTEEAK